MVMFNDEHTPAKKMQTNQTSNQTNKQRKKQPNTATIKQEKTPSNQHTQKQPPSKTVGSTNNVDKSSPSQNKTHTNRLTVEGA